MMNRVVSPLSLLSRRAALERADHATALQILRPLAEQGNAEAQFRLGVMHDIGQGVPRDFQETVKWLQRAAEQGHAEAQYYLVIAYHNGHDSF